MSVDSRYRYWVMWEHKGGRFAVKCDTVPEMIETRRAAEDLTDKCAGVFTIGDGNTLFIHSVGGDASDPGQMTWAHSVRGWERKNVKVVNMEDLIADQTL